jgi:hypothetical protein
MRLSLSQVNRLLVKAHLPLQLRPWRNGEWMYGTWHPDTGDATPSRHGWFTLKDAILCAVTEHAQHVDVTTLTTREQAILFANLSTATKHQLAQETP